MRLIYPLTLLFGVVFLFAYLPIYAVYAEQASIEFQQLRLDKALELSTRAAAQNGLEHGLVQFDRSELVEVEFNNSAALDTFATFMGYNYGLIPTEKVKEDLLGHVVLMTVGGRGFSVTQSEFGDYYLGVGGEVKRVGGTEKPQVTGTHISRLNSGSRTLFGVYTPFTVDYEDPNTGETKTVGGSILPNSKSYPIIYEGSDGVLRVDTSNSLPGDVTLTRVKQEALSMMSKAFTQSWHQLNIDEVSNKRITFPDTLTSSGINSMAKPGVMALVEGFDLSTSKPLRSEAFTGYKAVVRREVVVFTEDLNGVVSRWYCYRDQIDMERAMAGLSPYENIRIDYVYPNMLEAAQAKADDGSHYKPHIGLLRK